MTIKEAILKSLKDLKKPITHKNIYENIKRIKKELNEFSDKILDNETEIEKYCLEKSIPFEDDIDE